MATLTISALAVGSHNITAVYVGDADDAGSTSPVLTESVLSTMIWPTVTVAEMGGTYGGLPFPATVRVNGETNLEGVTPTLAYYAGELTPTQIASATPLSGAPSAAGTYTVVGRPSRGAGIMRRPAVLP